MANQKKTTKATKARQPSMMSTAFELIRKGRTNEQVMATLVKDFHVKEDHRHYAQWFRNAYIRKLEEEKASKKVIQKVRDAAHGKKYERGLSLKQLVAIR